MTSHVTPALDLAAPDAVYLAPGVGAQGATAAGAARVLAAVPGRVLPSASRAPLSAGPGTRSPPAPAEFRAALAVPGA